jgi:hypothetical protein
MKRQVKRSVKERNKSKEVTTKGKRKKMMLENLVTQDCDPLP